MDGKALKVPRKKCKEYLAYLVDRKGAGVTFSQLSAVLWEDKAIDRSVQRQTQTIVSELGKALKAVDAQDILIRTRVDTAINTKMVDCDFFRALSGDSAWIDTFTGEYMSNYSWGESTLGELIEIRQQKIKLLKQRHGVSFP